MSLMRTLVDFIWKREELGTGREEDVFTYQKRSHLEERIVFCFFLIIFNFIYLFILAALGLSCGTWDLSLRRPSFSLVVARGL